MNNATYPLTLFHESGCPMCNAEMTSLRQRDTFGRLRFVDVTPPDFVAPAGATREAMMEAIHGLTADGRWVIGVETLRLAYAAVGLGWLAAPTAWPWLREPAERAYRWVARHRHRFPGWLGPAFTSLALLRGERRREALQREAELAARRARCTGATCPSSDH